MTDQDQEQNQLSPEEMRAEPGVGRQDVEPNEMATWDGAGNQIHNVITDSESGHLSEGTGDTTEEAMKEARDSDAAVGENVGLKPHEK